MKGFLKITTKLLLFLACLVLQCVTARSQQQQWTVAFTRPDTGSRVVETDMWNAGRMNSRYKEFFADGSQTDLTESFAIFEVTFGDPEQMSFGGHTSRHGK
jgi:hypothetical protein